METASENIEFDDHEMSVPDTESVSEKSDSKHIRDAGYHKYKIGGHKSKKTIEFYDSTSVMGTTIRYATTGIYTSGHKVGSRDEDLYFKVVDTTHPPNSKGIHVPCYLYYESPEQWEKHFGGSCSEETKNTWREKYNRAIYRRMRAYEKQNA
jgi:hypothetical protein